jgi:hypothetical protein
MDDMTKDDVLERAKKRFEYSLERSSHNRDKAKQDIKFAAASPDDPWQWEDTAVKQRQLEKRPRLTINKLPQHIRQVTNDIRQNRPSIKFRPADNDADVEVAEILNGLARHIEANSDADVAYDFASDNQVTHGTGYIRVMADYVKEDSFDQDIFIRAVRDTFKCFDDPDAEDPAGADRRFFGIEDYLTEADFKAQYQTLNLLTGTTSAVVIGMTVRRNMCGLLSISRLKTKTLPCSCGPMAPLRLRETRCPRQCLRVSCQSRSAKLRSGLSNGTSSPALKCWTNASSHAP